MSILRNLLGRNAVLSEPAQPAAKAPAEPVPSGPEAQALRTAALKAELEGADAAKLIELATHDKRGALRLMAVEVLAGFAPALSTWEDIAKTWKDKDRRLARFAREQIATAQHRVQLDSNLTALQAEFEALLTRPAIDLKRLIGLDSRHALLQAESLKVAPTNGFIDIDRIRGEIARQLETGQDAQRQLLDIAHEADAALQALSTHQIPADPLVHAALADRFAALDRSAVPKVVVDRAVAALDALEALTIRIVAQGVAEADARTLMAQIEAVSLEDAEAVAQVDGAITAAKLPAEHAQRVTQAWNARRRGPDVAAEAAAQAARDAARAQRAAEKTAHQTGNSAARDALTQLITTLEVHLAAGEAKAALKAAGDIRKHRAAAEHLPGNWRARFHGVETEVLKLEGFARDVARTRRAELMARAHKLTELSLSIDMLRQEVQALQTEWKAIDAEAGGAPRKLWDEFHAATNKAYETVTLYRAIKTAERGEHLKAREAALAKVEGLLANAQSDAPDWKTIAAERGGAVRAWYEAGPADRKTLKPMQTRLDAAAKALDASLDAERARERDRRQGLMDQVEAARAKGAAEQPETMDRDERPWPALQEAMRVAQECQKQWNQRVSPLALGRKEEQIMWERFRALGNTIFEMRGAAREAGKARTQALRAATADEIREVRNLADVQDDTADPQALQTQLTALQTRWRQRNDTPDRQLERQHDEAVQAVRTRIADLKRAAARGVWTSLVALDVALAAAETALAASPGMPDALDTTTLEAVNHLAEKRESRHASHAGLNARLLAVRQGKPGPAADSRRRELMIDLELALGLPSPASDDSARRARQMLLLSQTLKNRATKRDPQELFLELCATSGAVDGARLAAIVGKL